MKAQGITRLLVAGAAFSLIYGAPSAPRADDLTALDPFATVESIETGDLDGLRGGDSTVNNFIEETITTTAGNNSTASIGTMSINTSGGPGGSGGGTGGTGGAVYGGAVTFSDNALQNFGGVYTSAVNTAPGGIATALTSMSVTLFP